jgi:hypothetical protein
MREASRLKMGYYPAPPEAIANAMQYLRACPTNASMIDPCSGSGEACQQIASAMGMRYDHVYCVELDAARGQSCRELMPGANVLSPCAFEHTAISNESFGLVFENPPFDEQIGGTRAELAFFARTPRLLVPGGVCLFVCPEHVAERYDFRKAWYVWFEDVACWRFPPEHRKFNEVFIVGRRRAKQRADDWDVPNFRMTYPLADILIPDAPGPKLFEKTALTDDELAAAVEDSPLLRLCEAQERTLMRRPPLALSVGHLALLLSSGQLDGLVCPPGGKPHVVRGTARKHEEVTEETTETDGDVRKTTTVLTERIRLVVRAVDSDGVIRNLD